MAEAIVPTTDPRWVPHENLSAVDRFFLKRIRNEKDLIFPRTALLITLILVPSLYVIRRGIDRRFASLWGKLRRDPDPGDAQPPTSE